MEHYYTSDPSAEHQYREITMTVKDRSWTFTTDSGVFSRDEADFGTRLLVSSLPPLSGRLLDLGCGWGALSIPLVLMNTGLRAVAVDVNRRALELCRRNAARLAAETEIFESDGFSEVQGSFDVIVTNPPIRAGKSVYYPWFDEAFTRLNQSGLFACVVQRKQGAPSVKARLTEIFGNCEVLAKDAGYWILAARKD